MKSLSAVTTALALLAATTTAHAVASPNPVEGWTDALKRKAEEIRDTPSGDADDQADRMGLVLMNAFEGYRLYFETDPDYPEWVSGNGYPHGNVINNPDTVYSYTRLDPQGTYRIWGKRNNVGLAVIQLQAMGMPLTSGRPLGHISLDDLHKSADGSFELLLSPSKPAEYQGDWRQLPAGTAAAFMRQVMFDWSAEHDAEVYIERLDRPALRPRRKAEDFDRQLAALTAYTSPKPVTTIPQPPVNALSSTGFGDNGGLDKQLYHWGRLALDDDQVMIVEGSAPTSCHYWNFQFTDLAMGDNMFPYRQSYLNHTSLHVDKDGRYRLVVSSKDPGVANWIDTFEHKNGYVLMRHEGCPEKLSDPVVKIINIKDLIKTLPKDTLWVKPEDRIKHLKEREHLIRSRYRI